MSKRHNITYVKPEEPNFLRKLKEQIGYKEGPTVETKNQPLALPSDKDFEDLEEEEQPQVVVLRSGDLTAEEAACEKLRLEKEDDQKPADLSARIKFKKPSKRITISNSEQSSSTESSNKIHQDSGAGQPKICTSKSLKRLIENQDSAAGERTIKKLKSTKLLSFDQQDEEEEEEEEK